MGKLNIKNSLSNTLGKAGFTIRKHSPEILLAAGVVGVVTSTVLACKATTKISGILEDTKKKVDTIHEQKENPDLTEEYTEEDVSKDLIITYTQAGLKLTKLYAPAIIIGAASITSILASHNIINKRYAGVSAAYAALDKGYKEYRKRVKEFAGEDAEKMLRYNVKAKEVEETVVDEKGKEKTKKKMVNVVDPEGYSEYAKFFDSSSKAWEKDPEYNLCFLRSQQEYANDLLRTKGRLFLNEVYDMLGIEPTKAGQIVGWIYDEDNPVGDNYVDFGIYEARKEKNRDFVNGIEPVILLDFNVDGNIWELM